MCGRGDPDSFSLLDLPPGCRQGMAMQMPRIVPALLFVGLAVGCAEDRSSVLEVKDVQFFEATASNAEGHTHLHISGLAFHSALAVKELEQNVDGASLHLAIVLVPARPGLSGSFDYVIDVPAACKTVTFGKSNAVVWRRAKDA